MSALRVLTSKSNGKNFQLAHPSLSFLIFPRYISDFDILAFHPSIFQVENQTSLGFEVISLLFRGNLFYSFRIHSPSKLSLTLSLRLIIESWYSKTHDLSQKMTVCTSQAPPPPPPMVAYLYRLTRILVFKLEHLSPLVSCTIFCVTALALYSFANSQGLWVIPEYILKWTFVEIECRSYA